MNGRIYDYNLGRFMSVDPFIQSPTSTQSVNPYSYIMNNPMAGTDPTGYCSTGTHIKGKDVAGCSVVFDAGSGGSGKKKSEVKVTSNGGNNYTASFQLDKKTTLEVDFKVTDIGSQGAIASGSGVGFDENYGLKFVPGQYGLSTTMVLPAPVGASTATEAIGSVGSRVTGVNPLVAAVFAAIYSPSLNVGDDVNIERIRSAAIETVKAEVGNRRDLWFHYTDLDGMSKIIDQGMIRANAKGLVYLTKFPMSPNEAVDKLFIGGWDRYARKGDFVLIFSTDPGVLVQPVKEHPFEWTHNGSLKFGREIEEVVYSGKNPF